MDRTHWNTGIILPDSGSESVCDKVHQSLRQSIREEEGLALHRVSSIKALPLFNQDYILLSTINYKPLDQSLRVTIKSRSLRWKGSRFYTKCSRLFCSGSATDQTLAGCQGMKYWEERRELEEAPTPSLVRIISFELFKSWWNTRPQLKAQKAPYNYINYDMEK